MNMHIVYFIEDKRIAKKSLKVKQKYLQKKLNSFYE